MPVQASAPDKIQMCNFFDVRRFHRGYQVRWRSRNALQWVASKKMPICFCKQGTPGAKWCGMEVCFSANKVNVQIGVEEEEEGVEKRKVCA